MISKRRWLVYAGIVAALIAAGAIGGRGCKGPADVVREVKPAVGSIKSTITSTAVVQPQNRLEIKPPINGRITEILAREGDRVRTGQTLAWMSSTERAALLDAARSYGEESLKYWEEVYKPTPLISPIDGEVIVSTCQPGQTVTSVDAVIVLSDRLIVQAQVDETDVGKVAVGQEVMISLDAYPEIRVRGRVDHIYYESKTVNNVTIYQVDILPETTPSVFRSGMTATVTIVEKAKDNVLLVPIEAVARGKDGDSVQVSRGSGKKGITRKVELGMVDEKSAEVVSGLTEHEAVLVVERKLKLSDKAKKGVNPFMPSRRR